MYRYGILAMKDIAETLHRPDIFSAIDWSSNDWKIDELFPNKLVIYEGADKYATWATFHGPLLWITLHTIIALAEELELNRAIENLTLMMQNVDLIIGCSECANHAREFAVPLICNQIGTKPLSSVMISVHSAVTETVRPKVPAEHSHVDQFTRVDWASHYRNMAIRIKQPWTNSWASV